MKIFASSIYLQIRAIAKTLLHALKFYGFGTIESPDYLVLRDRKVAYLIMPKAACSSIKKAMVKKWLPKEDEVKKGIHKNSVVQKFSVRGQVKKAEELYFFTYVRDPFERLVSAYINKFEDFSKIRTVGFLYEDYMGGYLKLTDSFEDFVRKVSQIHDRVSDRHFMSQSYLINTLSPHKIDTVFRLEDINTTFPSLSERYGFGQLSFANKSSNYEYSRYYKSQEILDLVKDRYKEDVETFGYQSTYDFLSSQLS